MIIKFLNVANLCLLMNNLNSVFSVVGALGFPEVKKLKDAWEMVPKKSKKIMEHVWSFMRGEGFTNACSSSRPL